MNWILLAVGAQLINAIVALVDKRIVSDSKTFPKPFVYAFYTCLVSGVWIIVFVIELLPIGFGGVSLPSFSNVVRPTLEVIALSYLSAYTFFLGLVSMFNALKTTDASDVVPVIGAVSALGSFGFGYFFLGTQLSSSFMMGIVLLATGTFLVSRLRFPFKIAALAVHSGLFFALHYVTIKGLFLVTSFDDGFFWSRVAFMFFALSLLLIPEYFKNIKEQTKTTSATAGVIIFTNKVLAGVSTILILKATDLGDVAVVQALGGLQYVFILILGLIFLTKHPKLPLIDKHYSKSVILQKTIFVAVITAGFLVLFM